MELAGFGGLQRAMGKWEVRPEVRPSLIDQKVTRFWSLLGKSWRRARGIAGRIASMNSSHCRPVFLVPVVHPTAYDTWWAGVETEVGQ